MAANFGDSEFEPTDEQLAELTREAFAGVATASARALSDIRARVSAERELILAKVDSLAKKAALDKK